MQNLRHLSNIFNHLDPKAEMFFCHSHQAMFSEKDARDAEWQRHLDWINKNVIGPPKETEKYTSRQLKEMGMIGIYGAMKEKEVLNEVDGG